MHGPLPEARSLANYNPRAAWERFALEADPVLRHFESAMQAPRAAQDNRLHQIVRANAGTRFGREHGFGTIRSIGEFRKRVPVSDWSAAAQWVARARSGERCVLTAEDPVHFERTSGSGARHKDIPYTPALLREFQSALVVWLASLVRDCPAIAGPGYWSLSPDPSPPKTTAAGLTVGSANDALYLAGSPAAGLLATIVGGNALSAGGDWRLATLRELAAEPDLRLLSVWSPTFLQSLLGLVLDSPRAEPNLATLQEALPGDRCSALLAAVGHRDFTRLWPNLQVVSCWTDGPSAVYSARLEPLFPGVRIAPKGLFATEGVVSLSFGAASARPVAITSHFIEFIDDGGEPRTVDELEIGQRYRPLLTTSGGLYRYRLGDVVEVSDFIARTPCLRFVGRDDSRSDLVGEKLDERIVADALHAAALPGTAALVPMADAGPPRYLLMTESPGDTAAAALEAALCRTHHYAIARTNGQLGAVTGCRVDNLAAVLHDAWQAAGRRSGDAKPAALIVSPDYAAAIVRTLADNLAAAG